MDKCDICERDCDKQDLIQVQELFTETVLGNVCLVCIDKIIAVRNLFPDEFKILIRTYKFNYFTLLKYARGLYADAET